MIKHYCDICGQEITAKTKKPDNQMFGEIKSGCGLPSLTIQVGVYEIDPRGDEDADVCKYCIIDAVNMVDDRPKQA